MARKRKRILPTKDTVSSGDEYRRRATEKAVRAAIRELGAQISTLSSANNRSTDASRKFLLSNQLLRAQKKMSDLQRRLKTLDYDKFRDGAAKAERKSLDRNAKRGALSATYGRRVQGGLPD